MTAFSYPRHVYSLAMPIFAEAASLSISLSEYATAQQSAGDQRPVNSRYSERARKDAASLQAAVDAFTQAIPEGARERILGGSGLRRHLYWINRRLDEGSPHLCQSDPIDIVRHDTPGILERFEEWYSTQSPVIKDLEGRVRPHIAAGQFQTALREAWPLFKTRMVDLFQLSDDLDGNELANKLFGGTGAIAGVLESREREGYLSLFRGLYALNRNPVVHNDEISDPEKTCAVLILINRAMIRIEGAINQKKAWNAE